MSDKHHTGIYDEDGKELVTTAVLERLDPIWIVNLRFSEIEAEWLLGLTELHGAQHGPEMARHLAGMLKGAILRMHERRRADE